MPLPEPTCRDDARRSLLGATLPSIDYLEVQPGYVVLKVVFFNTPSPEVNDSHVTVEGGIRIRGIRVLKVEQVAGENAVNVTVDRWGDHSPYTLVVTHPSFDPYYSRVDFRFTVDCPSRFDCRTRTDCPPADEPAPLIDYLAKDYASFRQAMLDLLSVRVPGWKERHEADLGVTLVELLSYVGDQLSYYQDAVANEAYLETARLRVSVRRHARLIDYHMHDGATARAVVALEAKVNGTVKAGTRFVTKLAGPLGSLAKPGAVIPHEHGDKAEAAGVVFESLADVTIDPRLNGLQFHTWGNARCQLCVGATQADVQDPTGDLATVFKGGTLLLIEEHRSPDTFDTHDADPTRRQGVRVTNAVPLKDPVLGKDLVRVFWAAADALRTSFCLSAKDEAGNDHFDISVARGNLVLADQGRRYTDEHPQKPTAPNATPVPVGFRPYRFALAQGPLAFRHPPPVGTPPAVEMMTPDPQAARPWVDVNTTPRAGAAAQPWDALPDLLASRALDTHVAVETDDDGRAVLRFGDNINGRSPDGLFVKVEYRATRGAAGNVTAGAIAHAIDVTGSLTSLVSGVRNPLPAWGGADPEPVERVKRLAPDAFRTGLYRAVTEADYARAAELHPAVDHAAARFRWTGSWRTVYLLIDPKGRTDLPPELRAEIHRHVSRFALAGYDLEVRPAVYASLEVVLTVCVCPQHLRAHVERAVRDVLTARGGFFSPDRFTFGDPVYLSQIYAAVMGVTGVISVAAARFHRTDQPDPPPLFPSTAANVSAGRITVGRFEIARLDNAPDFPEHGTLGLQMEGGR